MKENNAIQPLNLNVSQAAQLLGTTPWAIRKLATKGKLPYTQLGKRFLFSRAELEKWNQKQMRRRKK